MLAIFTSEYEIFITDNNASNNHSIEPEFRNNSITVTLSSLQYSFYEKYQVEIKCPDGNHLEYIGYLSEQHKAEDNSFRLREQLSLVACLLSNIEGTIQFPPYAAMGLAELLYRIQEIKKWS